MERTFAGVIFDNDGTLVNSLGAIFRAWGVWAGEHGITEEQLQGWHGHSSEHIVRELVPDNADAALERVQELEVAEVDGIVPIEGAVESLAALPPERVAVATSGTAAVATARLRAAGIEIPAVLVTADDVEHAKPAPDIFLAAAERLGLDPRDCVVIEDAPSGIQAAKAAGCATIGITTTVKADELDADLVVGTLADLVWSVEPDGIRVAKRG